MTMLVALSLAAATSAVSALRSAAPPSPSRGLLQGSGERVAADTSVRPLAVGDTVERLAAPGAEHVYTLPLARGRWIRLALTTSGPPVEVSVRAPDGNVISQESVWGPRKEPEAPPPHPATTLDLLAEATGPFRVNVRTWSDTTVKGSYRLAVQALPPTQAATEDSLLAAATTWLKTNAHPLRAVAPGRGFEDLAPLERTLAGVRVVGLGEATHGTHEFHLAKHRLFEFLVERMGYTVFALESSQTVAWAIDRYVVHGTGDRDALLAAQGFFNWDVREVSALLDWMRDYNRRHAGGRQLRFVGFDFQVNPGSHAAIVDFLRRVAPERVAAADSALALLTDPAFATRPDFIRYYTLTPDAKRPLVQWVDDLRAFLERNAAALARRTSTAEVASVRQRVRLLSEFADAHARPGYAADSAESGVATRDRYMAENILAMLDSAPGLKMVVSAHNGHVRRDAFRMGYYLRQRLGRAYYALGMGFERGTYQALLIPAPPPRPVTEFVAPPARQGSVGWYMRRAGIGDLFVDLRALPATGPAAEWLARTRLLRSVGNGSLPDWDGYGGGSSVVLPRVFDGFLFVERTTRAHSNASPGPGAPAPSGAR